MNDDETTSLLSRRGSDHAKQRGRCGICVLVYDKNTRLIKRDNVVVDTRSNVKKRIMKYFGLRNEERFVLLSWAGRPVTNEDIVPTRTYILSELP